MIRILRLQKGISHLNYHHDSTYRTARSVSNQRRKTKPKLEKKNPYAMMEFTATSDEQQQQQVTTNTTPSTGEVEEVRRIYAARLRKNTTTHICSHFLHSFLLSRTAPSLILSFPLANQKTVGRVSRVVLNPSPRAQRRAWDYWWRPRCRERRNAARRALSRASRPVSPEPWRSP